MLNSDLPSKEEFYAKPVVSHFTCQGDTSTRRARVSAAPLGFNTCPPSEKQKPVFEARAIYHLAWETRSGTKRKKLSAAIPPQWRLIKSRLPGHLESSNVIEYPEACLSEQEIKVSEAKPPERLANMHAEVWCVEDVTRTFCHHVAIAHQLMKCLTEILFDEALKQARSLDHYSWDTEALKGPFHGLPISFTDRFRVASDKPSPGCVPWLGQTETLGGALLARFAEKGLVLL